MACYGDLLCDRVARPRRLRHADGVPEPEDPPAVEPEPADAENAATVWPGPAAGSAACTRAEANILSERKGDLRVAVCLPALNEAATIGGICEAVRENLMAPGAPPLVDELWVLHSSDDDTPAVAAAAGARVAAVSDLLPEAGRGRGKGDALWKSLSVTDADLIVWCDADLLSFSPAYVTSLLAPFLLNANAEGAGVVMVKAHYQRWLGDRPTGGGRTTELVAKPLISLFFPELSHISQPLSGEYAVRRGAAMQVPFVQGYGVEMGLLIDLSRRFGAESIVQADLGIRRHRNRPLAELAPQSLEIIQVVLERAGVEPPRGAWEAPPADKRRVQGAGAPLGEIPGLRERPPMRSFLRLSQTTPDVAKDQPPSLCQPQPLVAPQVAQA